MQATLPNMPVKGELIAGKQCADCGCGHFVRTHVGPHVGLYCGACGKWQEWTAQEHPYDPDFVMPFGEHKGTKISLLPTEYLLRGRERMTGGMKKRFEQALNHRGFMFLVYLWEAYQEVYRKGNTTDVSIFDVRAAFTVKHPKTTMAAFNYWLQQVSSPEAKQKYPSHKCVLRDGYMQMWYKPSKMDVES